MKNIILATILLTITACSSVKQHDPSLELIKEQYSVLTNKTKLVQYCKYNVEMCRQYFNGRENAYQLNAVK